MKPWFTMISVIVLTACSSQPEWSKPGVSPQETSAALGDCQKQSQQAIKTEINSMSDMLATRGLDWEQTGVLEVHLQEFEAEIRQREGPLIKRCMIGKGFVPAGGML